jgi:hypothetical protein
MLHRKSFVSDCDSNYGESLHKRLKKDEYVKDSNTESNFESSDFIIRITSKRRSTLTLTV